MNWRRFPNRHLVTNRSTTGSKKIRRHNSKINQMLVDYLTIRSKGSPLPQLSKNIPPSMSRPKDQSSLKLRSKLFRRFQQKWGQRNRASNRKWIILTWFRTTSLSSNNRFLTRHQSWQLPTLIAVSNLYRTISTRSSSQLHKETLKIPLTLLLWVWMRRPSASPRLSSQAGPTSQMSLKPSPFYRCKCGAPVSEIIHHLIVRWLDHNLTSLTSIRTYQET